MTKKRKHLGEILYKAGLVKKEALIDAIKTGKSNNKRLGQVLLDLKLIDEELEWDILVSVRVEAGLSHAQDKIANRGVFR